MVMVFALAAASCLGIYARANTISKQLEARDAAVTLACNAAEILKNTGDPQQAEALAESDGFILEICGEKSEIPGLCRAKIVVYFEETEIFSLQTGWQEVAP